MIMPMPSGIHTNPNAPVFEHMVIGKEVQDRTSKRYQFDVRASSALPAYKEPKVGSDKCFEQTSINANVATGKKSLSDCMLAASTPSKMLYEQVDVENTSSSTLCIPYGKGTLSSILPDVSSIMVTVILPPSAAL